MPAQCRRSHDRWNAHRRDYGDGDVDLPASLRRAFVLADPDSAGRAAIGAAGLRFRSAAAARHQRLAAAVRRCLAERLRHFPRAVALRLLELRRRWQRAVARRCYRPERRRCR